MRQPQSTFEQSPSSDPEPAISHEHLESTSPPVGRPGARVPQGRAFSAGARARMARLISGPVPVALVAFLGLLTIALTGAAGRGYTHRLLLTAVLAENVGALFLRNRHPLLALSGVALTYAIVDYLPTTLPALLVALLTALVTEDRRTSRVAVIIGS